MNNIVLFYLMGLALTGALITQKDRWGQNAPWSTIIFLAIAWPMTVLVLFVVVAIYILKKLNDERRKK